MCDKHQPIVVYDCGGTQTYCEKCGKPIGKWEQNSKPKKHTKKEKNGNTESSVRNNQT